MAGSQWRFYLFLFIFGALGLVVFSQTQSFSSSEATKPLPRVCCDPFCFEVEVVDTPQTRARGLMGRRSMPEDKGMLFVFDYSDVHSFWMKNTLIPLDMLWLDEHARVVFTSFKVAPCVADPCPVIKPEAFAKYVLELSAGVAERADINAGTQCRIDGVVAQ